MNSRAANGRTLLTLRVSRDGGRTYGPPRTVTGADTLPPLLTATWPPCRCPRCRRGGRRP